jgi:cellulose biosynthesis protein BcsQ
VALHQLETMQDDLIKLFNDRFDEINKKIGGLRTNLEIKPKAEKPKQTQVPVESTETEAEKEAKKRPKKPSPPKKTEAEERIDQIRSEVEKVLERLGQMETEA